MLDSIDKLQQFQGYGAPAASSKQTTRRPKLTKIDKMDAAIFQMINPNKEKHMQYAMSVIVAINVFIILFAILTKDFTLAMVVPAVWLLSPW